MKQHSERWNYQDRLEQRVPPKGKRASSERQQNRQYDRADDGVTPQRRDASTVLGDLAVDVQDGYLTVESSGAAMTAHLVFDRSSRAPGQRWYG